MATAEKPPVIRRLNQPNPFSPQTTGFECIYLDVHLPAGRRDNKDGERDSDADTVDPSDWIVLATTCLPAGRYKVYNTKHLIFIS